MKPVSAALITFAVGALTWSVTQPSFGSDKGVIVWLVMGAATPALYVAIHRALKPRKPTSGSVDGTRS